MTYRKIAIIAGRLVACVLVAAGLGAERAAAQSFTWGSEFGSTLVRSDGATPLDQTFSFDIGRFLDGFVPTAANVHEWTAHWVVADTIQGSQFNAPMGYYTSEVQLADNVTFPVGAEVFVWVYNSKAAGTGTEWLLYTNNSSDGVTADNWQFPAAGCCGGPKPPASFRLADASTALFGALPTSTGEGFGVTPSATFSAQTFSVVPEPASISLVLSLLIPMVMRRRRA